MDFSRGNYAQIRELWSCTAKLNYISTPTATGWTVFAQARPDRIYSGRTYFEVMNTARIDNTAHLIRLALRDGKSYLHHEPNAI